MISEKGLGFWYFDVIFRNDRVVRSFRNDFQKGVWFLVLKGMLFQKAAKYTQWYFNFLRNEEAWFLVLRK